ncbi:MAG: alpha/beta hydrolase [Dehalococcoidia bacterium]|nr:alpha/beta hydrolase [Dehalococcoidia bacterium]
MAELTVNGATLSFDDTGTGGPAFVFVHGFACDRQAWAPQVADLGRDHRCINVDLRGRGTSAALPPFDVVTAADDVAALISELGLGPAVVVGHSLGGVVALVLNERHPDLVLGTVIGDSPVSRAMAETRGPGLPERIREAGTMEPAARMVERFWAEDTPPDVRAYGEVLMSCPPDVAAGMLDGFPEVAARFGELVRLADRKPFMAIWSGAPLGDPAWLRDQTMFVRQEPVPGTGHFFQLEQPAITNALLRAFLDDVANDPRVSPD